MISAKDLRAKCNEARLPYSGKLAQMARSAKSTVRDFCRKYQVSLDSVDVTAENTRAGRVVVEPIFYFSDNSQGENFGGYTLKGLRNSLRA